MGLPEMQKPIPNESIENEGLPVGAKKYTSKRTAQVLEDLWHRQIKFYKETEMTTHAGIATDEKSVVGLKEYEVDISGVNSSVFKGTLHPTVEGHSWFRGISAKVDKDNPLSQVIIFTGFIGLTVEKTSPPPIIYIVGDVPHQTVNKVARSYRNGILLLIKDIRMLGFKVGAY